MGETCDTSNEGGNLSWSDFLGFQTGTMINKKIKIKDENLINLNLNNDKEH